ncbi:TPA: ABC-three component system protein [Legionella pneumophila]
MADKYQAHGAFLGYLYQCRYALSCLIEQGKNDPEICVYIEKFDDIQFDSHGEIKELIQTKHHTTPKNISNTSEDLWKTLDVWIERFKKIKQPISYFLITNSTASKNSIAEKLRFDNRDSENALQMLIEISETSSNQNLQSTFNKFKKLSPLEQKSLVQKIVIFDKTPNILDLEKKIKKEFLTTIRPQYHDPIFERLEGWWLKIIISHLANQSEDSISARSLRDKIYNLTDQFKPDNLPDDFWDWDGDEISLDHSNRTFVKQLNLIAIHERRIRHAIRDYYRAFNQRSKWAREDLLINDEIEKYEKKLIEEWTRYRDRLLDNLPSEATDEDCKEFGRKLYNWVDGEANIKIRPNITAEYIMRGSYQILSDDLKIGWHPDFVIKLKEVLKKI